MTPIPFEERSPRRALFTVDTLQDTAVFHSIGDDALMEAQSKRFGILIDALNSKLESVSILLAQCGLPEEAGGNKIIILKEEEIGPEKFALMTSSSGRTAKEIMELAAPAIDI